MKRRQFIHYLAKQNWHKGHDGKIITRVFFYLSREYPNGYMAVGYLLFLQEQIKGIIINIFS
jgi:hypothetical protein